MSEIEQFNEESTAQESSGTEYVLDESSEFTEVEVDDKRLVRSGDPVTLTQDQYDRASAAEGVKLVESAQATDENEE